MKLNRLPTKQEQMLLDFLVKNASINFPIDWRTNLLVCEMDDGGMGSLSLFPKGLENEKRKFGAQVSEYLFDDKDGVLVSATLNVDTSDRLFELDMWKVDSSPLIHFPEVI
jgi:hypothetical protein